LKELFVGGIDYKVDNDQLRAMFERYGTVESARVIVDQVTGRSRGFGFVKFSNAAEAQKAIDNLNGTQLDGLTLTVNEARPKC